MKITKPKQAVFIGVLLVMVIGPLLVRATFEMLHGHGAEQYQNVYGLGIAWSSLLVLVAVLAGALLVALIARVVYFWKLKRGL
jgi:uncharacterized membrane protein